MKSSKIIFVCKSIFKEFFICSCRYFTYSQGLWD